MIEIKRFVCNMLQENTYVMSDETREAVIIDCGAFFDAERDALLNYLEHQQLKPVHLLSTHGHFDHNFGNDTIWSHYGLKPEVPAEDEAMMDLKKQVEDMLGTTYPREVPPIGKLLSTDDVIMFGTHKLTILATPGHTRGSVTYYCPEEGIAFTGDTLFRMSIGRTDFPGGSWALMMGSLRLLSTLPANTKVYAGHGEPTTIGDELKYNPYMSH
ncbi:MAG: MBL fold metallo-hydrolase [Prevotella sp.]|nr:MBL fold metallo-hydrolase [Prevotella sp.]